MSDHRPRVDARTAAAITAGMMAVALADGEAHPHELALLATFREGLPDDIDPSGVVITDPTVRRVLVRSLFAVALADGVVGDAEREVIEEIARAHGASRALLDAEEGALRREMLATFRGVRHGRAQAEDIGAALGLPPDEVRRILDAVPDEA